MTNFTELLYRSLPGLYRDKDGALELRRFLDLAALPLEEIERSIGELYLDFYLNTCRDAFVPLIGSVLGIEPDSRLPAKTQRMEAADALLAYQSKGLASRLEIAARQLTSFAVTTVDFSQRVTITPSVQDTNPLLARRNGAVAEDPTGSGFFFFRADRALLQLYDASRGRAISRTVLAGAEPQFAGIEGGFSIREDGTDVFTRLTGRYAAVAADLSDFASPKTSTGAPLAQAATEIAVDPVLGRFRITAPMPVRASLTCDYQELVPGSLARAAFDIRDPVPITRLGLADDPAPYTFDLRSPGQPTDRSGRMHFDNYGFYFTPGQMVAGGRPTLLAEGPPAIFSFDGRPLAPGDTEGTPLQLQDGLDGTPLTRARLSGREAEYCGSSRGFAIRIGGVNLLDPGSDIDAHVVAADLSNPAAPTDSTGAPLPLAANDVAVDPELGRFVLDVAALGTSSDQVRVDFLLGPARVVSNAFPSRVDVSLPDLFQFSAVAAPLRDAIDGALIASKLRLGRSVIAFHGTARGWVIRHNGADVSGALTASIQPLDSASAGAAVAPGTIAIDPDRGRFRFPAGVLAAGDAVTVDFCDEDVAAGHQVLAGFAQRAARLVPAGVTAVALDSRKVPVAPASLA